MAPVRFLLLSSALLLAPSAFAEPAPQLVALDEALVRTLEDSRQGRLEAKAYEDAIADFRADLAATVSGLEPSPAIAEANAVLERDPKNKDALAVKYSSQGRADPSRASIAAPAGASADVGVPAKAVVVTKSR